MFVKQRVILKMLSILNMSARSYALNIRVNMVINPRKDVILGSNAGNVLHQSRKGSHLVVTHDMENVGKTEIK